MAELLNFEIMDYKPARVSSVKRLYAMSRKVGEKHVGLHAADVKKVWENPDDLAAHRARIEATHPTLEIFIVSVDADAVVSEISYPRRDISKSEIETPGAGTW